MRHRQTNSDLHDIGAFTVDELADYLRVGRTTANHLVTSGEIPSFRIGRMRRVMRAAADQWLREASSCGRSIDAGPKRDAASAVRK